MPKGGSGELELPIPLAESAQKTGVEMEQVSIVSSTANPVEKGTVVVEQTTYTVGNLENLKTYYFAVAPISNAGGQTWEGGKSKVVSATPQPNSVPDKPDSVTVTPGDTLLTVTWKPGKDTVSSRVQYRVKGEGEFTVLPSSYQSSATITGLKNDVTYEVQVYGVNSKRPGVAEGTPKLSDIEGPELPTVNRL